MDGSELNALGTLLNATGLGVAIMSLVVSGVVFHLSRAGKVRAFENRVYTQLTNANSRIEQVESQWLAEKAALTAIADEMVTTQDRTAKERRRLYAETKRAEVQAGLVPNGPQDLSTLPREEQLRQVRASLAGTR